MIPSAARTPARKSRTSVLEDCKDRFAGIIWCDQQNSFDSQFIETYDVNVSYSKRPFIKIVNGCAKKYQNYLLVVDTDGNEEYFVMAKEMISKYTGLEKQCPCITCRSSVFSPLKYIWCPVCTGCLKSPESVGTVNLDRQPWWFHYKVTIVEVVVLLGLLYWIY